MLNEYLQQVQLFLRDERQSQLNPEDIIKWINKARRETAMRAFCLRQVTPITGSIKAAIVNSGGQGYTAPTVVISPPDFADGVTASATATLTGGAITAINITFGGSGYFNPTIDIIDGTGSGADVTPVLTFIGEVVEGQEFYPFSAVDLSAFPGLKSVYMIKSVSVIYSNYRYSLPCYSFSTFQAYYRNYINYQYVPWVCAQVGKGTNGRFYFYPIPNQPYQIEWDSFCLPIDLIDDLSVEAIPDPFTDAVPFLAAHYCYLTLQNMNSAEYFKKQFDEWMSRYGAYTMPGRWINPYGRY